MLYNAVQWLMLCVSYCVEVIVLPNMSNVLMCR